MFFFREYHDALASTNDTAKQKAKNGAPEGTVIIAGSQTSGRGRHGRTFWSPRGGLYMSIVLRPSFSDVTLITPSAAVAVCRALCGLGFDCRIKWVNDIYLNDKKVCGILTESDVTAGWAVLGIGVNTVCPGADAPDIAGGLYEKECDNQPIITAILNEFDSVYSGLPKTDFIGYYREKSYLSGRSVTVDGTVYESARICDDFSLLVEGKNGKRYLKNGEVSVIPM